MEEKNMKRNLIMLATLFVAVVACNKYESPVETPASSPVRMTMTATIGADTKITYVDEDNVLKAAWAAGDKVSLLAVDASGKLLSNDIFTAKAAGKTAEFEGTFANPANTAHVMVYYPALTEGEGTEEKPYMSPVENGYNETGVLCDSKVGSQYMRLRSTDYFLQKNNADPSSLNQYAAMCGQAEMNGNEFTVSLEHMAFVIKAVFTLPADDIKVSYVTVSHKTSGGGGTTMTYNGAREIYGLPYWNNSTGYIKMNFGEIVDSGSGTGFIVDGNTLTVYLLGYDEIEIEDDNYFKIELYSPTEGYYSGKKTLSANVLEPGKMYRMNLTLTEGLL